MTPLTLPFPPSVNHYWRMGRGRMYISDAGEAYRKAVNAALLGMPTLTCRVRIRIVAHPPDNRRRDLDNLLKASLDGLVHGGALEDDSQIDDLRIVRGENRRNGELTVFIEPMGNDSQPIEVAA